MAPKPDFLTPTADILVVDDNIANLRLLTGILIQAGYQVRAAEHPSLAIESALAYPPGLILLDVRMPEMSGFELCRHLKADERTRKVPIIFVSALQDTDDKVRGFEAGGVDFISKPFQESEVLARVKNHLQLRTMQLQMETLVAERTAELTEANQALQIEIAERRRAEQSLQRSAAKFRAIFDHASMGIALAGADLAIADANAAFLQLVGYSVDELQEIDLTMLSPAEDNERERLLIREVLNGNSDSYSLEKRFKCKDGREIWTDTHSAAVRDEKGKIRFSIGIVQDITERLDAEKALKASEEEFRQLIDQSPLSIMIFRLDGRVEGVNETLKRLWGFPDDVLAEVLAKYNILEDPETRMRGVMPLVEKAFEGEAVERPMIEYDGSIALEALDVDVDSPADIIWIRPRLYPVKNERGELVRVVQLAENVSDKVHAELKLRKSEERFRATFEQAAVGIAHVAPNGDFLRLNHKFCDIVGYSHGEMLERTFQDITHPDDLDIDLDRMRGLLAGETGSYTMEKRYFCKGGEIVWVNLTVNLLRQATGEPDYFVAVVEDITASKALREERDRILEMSQDLICIAGMDGYLKYVSPAWERMLGYTQEELLGSPFLDFIHPDDHARANTEVEHLETGYKTLDFENRYIHKDGTIRYISWIATPLQEEKMRYCIGRDVTERKQTEEALQESEANFRAVIEQSPVSIQIHGPDGELQKSNDAYAKLYALNDEMLKELYEKYNVFADAQAEALGLMPYVEETYSGEIVQFPVYEYKGIDTLKTMNIANPVARTCWVETVGFPLKDEDGKITSVVFMSEDRTERQQAEAALREARLFTDNLIETANVIIVGLDVEGLVQTFNPTAERITGYAKQDLIGKNWFGTLVPDETYPRVGQEFRRLIGGGTPRLFENPIITKDGEERIIAWSNNEVRVDGKAVGMISFGIDVTERKQTEQAILDYQQRLKWLASELTLAEEHERRRIAALLHDGVGQTLALARIQLARALRTSSETQRKGLLEDTSGTLLDIIQVTRNLVYDLSSPLLNEIGLEAAISSWLEAEADKKLDIKSRVFDDGYEKSLSEDMRVILFRNVRELVTNVVKHAHATSIEVRLERVGDNIRVSVEDDGVGMDTGARAMITKGGGGFGLFSIQERMSDLGGSLDIVSEPGRGYTATLTAPLATDHNGD